VVQKMIPYFIAVATFPSQGGLMSTSCTSGLDANHSVAVVWPSS
jgi:hypothetical protein